MSTVQVERESYEMPPREGISIAHFLTVADAKVGLNSTLKTSKECSYAGT